MRLIEAVENYGKSKGCAWMQLNVLGNNDRAIAFMNVSDSELNARIW
ncbi:GNAT family N-acetyltransferase [Escherichia coli]|nr:GNAT family N-acetyltransferase [Escherichia coli]